MLMKRFDVGIYDGHIVPVVSTAPEPRHMALVGVAARNEREAIARTEDQWRLLYGDEPPKALIGISWPY
jgi:hypothetical protein